MIGRTPMKTRSASAASGTRTRREGDAINQNHHCKACTNEDNTRMVQCDKCNDWYHFACVSVDQDVADRDWLCPTCQPVKGAKEKSSAIHDPARLPVSTHTCTNPTVRVTSVPLNIRPQSPSQFALPHAAVVDGTNISMLTHVDSNHMFPPLST